MMVEHLRPSHEVVEHISEIRLLLRAGSLGELLAEAGRALAELQLRGPPPPPEDDWRSIEVSAPDRAALLADWLNELVFQAEIGWWVPTEFRIEQVGETRVHARARGVKLDHVPGLVKAATLHGLRVEELPGGLEGEVVLDV